LITLLIFAVSAVTIEWTIGYGKLKKYIRLISGATFILWLGGLIGDNVALKWGCWVYNPERFLGIYIFGIPLETHFFALFVSIAITTATLAWSDFEEQGRPLIKGTFDEVVEKLKHFLTI